MKSCIFETSPVNFQVKKVVIKSKFILKKNGFLALEIGHDQYFKVKKILNEHGFYIFKTIKDYQKIKRCLIAKKTK